MGVPEDKKIKVDLQGIYAGKGCDVWNRGWNQCNKAWHKHVDECDMKLWIRQSLLAKLHNELSKYENGKISLGRLRQNLAEDIEEHVKQMLKGTPNNESDDD